MNKHDSLENENIEETRNEDPLTGQPGAHPAATGVGAAGAGLAGAAAGTALGGPIGGVIGAVVGAVAGGLGGKATGEAIDPTAEEAYWRENHSDQAYARNDDYDNYASAYRAGYTATSNQKDPLPYEDVEADMRTQYEAKNEELPWDQAGPAARAAYLRAQNRNRQASPDALSPTSPL